MWVVSKQISQLIYKIVDYDAKSYKNTTLKFVSKTLFYIYYIV